MRYIDPDGRESGYVIDNDGAAGMGHAGMYVEMENGNYAFFEVTGISKKSNGLSPNLTTGDKQNDKWGTNTTILSNEKLEFPSPETAESKDMPGQAGALLRVFSSKEEMLKTLGEMGFDECLDFNTTKEQDKCIYNNALSLGLTFSGYNLINNSCGIYAANALTSNNSGLSLNNYNPLSNLNFLFSGSIPNIIGANLYLANSGCVTSNRIQK